MINTLLGIKKGMTSTYDARKRRVGATVIEVSPNLITQIKNKEGSDGYSAVQIGMGDRTSVKKPQLGHIKKAKIDQRIKWFREVRDIKNTSGIKEEDLGKEIKIGDVFSKGDAVKIVGVSRGRGFQGGVRRHGFAGGPKTHGQSDRHRAPGSIGQTTTPGRVYKGKRMAGHMGAAQSSVKGLEVIDIDKQNNLLTIKGGVPGYNGALLIIEKLGRIKGYVPPPEEKADEEELQETKNEEKNDNQPTEQSSEAPVAKIKEEANA